MEAHGATSPWRRACCWRGAVEQLYHGTTTTATTTTRKKGEEENAVAVVVSPAAAAAATSVWSRTVCFRLPRLKKVASSERCACRPCERSSETSRIRDGTFRSRLFGSIQASAPALTQAQRFQTNATFIETLAGGVPSKLEWKNRGVGSLLADSQTNRARGLAVF